MANVLVEKQSLVNAADAIREKLGTQELITPEDFGEKIGEISGGGGSDYGTIEFYAPDMSGAEITETYGCEAEITDPQKLFNFCVNNNFLDNEEQIASYPEIGAAIYYDYNYSAWVDSMRKVKVSTEELVTNGLNVVKEGDGDAHVFILFNYTIDENTPTTTRTITSELDYFTLGFVNTDVDSFDMGRGENAIITIGDDCFPRQFIKSYTFGDDCRKLPEYFLARTTYITDINGFSQTDIVEIPKDFLYCSDYSKPITFPSTLKKIGDEFMCGCQQFSQNLNLLNVEEIGNSFLAESNYNGNISLPKVKKIGQQFLSSCSSFNKDLTIPATVTEIGTSFMQSMRDMTATIYVETDGAITVGAYTLTATNNSCPAYTTGIGIGGTYAQLWRNKFEDRTTFPYRKLRLVS